MSTINLKITDETFAGKILNEIRIAVSGERLTIKDIIEARVYAEVEAYNDKLTETFTGLVQPTDAEAFLNGFKIKKVKRIDAEKQVYTALDAFQKNGFFVLIDNRQAESLEEEILVNNESTVSFIKLTPLVGG
ncbi:hypothetical protein SAMN05192574_103192 [Mucilaginibacter gossypiicola]|uniref:Uncharacterized protein n=1 Tax=Mucilaginibacter gossypiicola TaxID=551995 RepID=A0A1H8GLD4_9SPHI|nr:hypothetical protein [Mucilaginibacter gossypiicola]SEN44812.1 hypothetical protein SAMN05192574_103192 [Mucilaginibacter gossypiicola]